MLRRSRITHISLLVGLFLLILLSQFVLVFYKTQTNKQKELDLRLKTAAEATDLLLDGQNLHAHLTKDRIDRAQEMEYASQLQRLAQEFGVAYLYSGVIRQGEVLFVTSNPTPEELAGRPYEPVFLSVYDDASSELMEAIESQTIHYAEYVDRWGAFRSVFVPKLASDGQAYFLGVDVHRSDMVRITEQSVILALQQTVLFFALSFPFVLIAIRSAQRLWRDREATWYVDELTGLGNKQALINDIEQCRFPSLVLINIDRFREVTSVYGVADGDVVLRAFAYNLASFKHEKLTGHKAYRIHADEFAVLADMEHSEEERIEVFRDFYKMLVSQRYRLAGERVVGFTVKCGVSVGKKQDLFSRAALALGRARESNVSVVQFEQERDLLSHYRDSITTSDHVRLALNEDRIVPFFHPIVCTRSQKIEKYEVLARIVDKHGDVLLMPDQFIPILKRDRRYAKFTSIILKKAITVAKREAVDISLNISTQDVADQAAFRDILSTISHSGIADKIHIELLECDSLVSLEDLVLAITRIKKLGCRVGLDDLGKGYSNFDRLTSLPIDFVKLDRSVMPNISGDIEVMRIAEDIIKFAKDIHITTVAEFCNTRYLCSAARHMGIDFIQGFYLAEPSPDIIREVEAF